jgi:hypothetical protein
MATIVAALLGPIIAALLAWGIGSFITDRWDETKRRRDLDLSAVSEFYLAYGEFLGVWRLWSTCKRYGQTSKPPAYAQWLCLSRASAVESRLEALLIRTTMERSLSADQRELLACFREASQRLRESIRKNQDLNWFTRRHENSLEFREYRAFKELSAVFAQLLQQQRPKIALLSRRATAGIPTPKESRQAWLYVTSGKDKHDWLRRAESKLMLSPTPQSGLEGESTSRVEIAQYLWGEYAYRHDLIWRLLFRVTTVATALSIAPFGIENLVVQQVGLWVAFLPVLAVLLVVGSSPLFHTELRRFHRIKDYYRRFQNEVVGEQVHDPRTKDLFDWLIPLYLAILFILSSIVALLVWFDWYPSL